jgi:hypothetical protein
LTCQNYSKTPKNFNLIFFPAKNNLKCHKNKSLYEIFFRQDTEAANLKGEGGSCADGKWACFIYIGLLQGRASWVGEREMTEVTITPTRCKEGKKWNLEIGYNSKE